MKNLFQRLTGRPDAAEIDPDSTLSTTLLPPFEPPAPVSWPVRAAELGAQPLDAVAAARQCLALWAEEPEIAALGADAPQSLARVLLAATLPAGARPVQADETSPQVFVLLEGRLATEQRLTDGRTMPVAQARPGDVLCEPGGLDGGPRSAGCLCQGPCAVAVLPAEGLQQLASQDAALAAALYAVLARRLSLRLRHATARLGALLAQP